MSRQAGCPSLLSFEKLSNASQDTWQDGRRYDEETEEKVAGYGPYFSSLGEVPGTFWPRRIVARSLTNPACKGVVSQASFISLNILIRLLEPGVSFQKLVTIAPR